MTVPGGETPSGQRWAYERRTNLALRALIDDMLSRVRELSRNATSFSADERARIEAELESLMARVRRAAAQQHTP